MKNLSKKVVQLLWLAALSLVTLQGEEISRYHTHITLLPSGSLHIKEDITYDFGSLEKHGIFRDIPIYVKTDTYSNEIPVGLEHIFTKMDGKDIDYTSKKIDSKTSGQILRLKIGDPNHKISGKHTYTIEYDAKRGVYPSTISGMDAVRWNAVGSGSRIPTKHAVAYLVLPDIVPRDSVKTNSYVGRYGENSRRASSKWVGERSIRFEAYDLSPHEALTIEANIPKGILKQQGDDISTGWSDRLLGNWHWGALLGFFLYLWNYAKRFGVYEYSGAISPQYYPPKDLSLLQSGLIIDKFADKKDFAAAVLELGSLGYLEIDNTKKPPIIKKTDKSSDQGDLTMDQKYILDGILFGGRNQYRVESGDPEIAQRMDDKLSKINDLLYEWSVSSGQMRTNPKQSRSKFLTRAGIMMLVLDALAIYSTVRNFGVDATMLVVMGSIFLGVGAFVLLNSIQAKAYGGIIFGAVWLAVTTVGFGSILTSIRNIGELILSPAILIPLMAIMVWYFYKRVGLFTQKGLDTYRYLMGYKEFMGRVEKDRIRRFLKQDPLYLDKGLPYAVLFGHNKHWLKLYEDLNAVQPVWYYGDLYRMDSFNHAVQSQSVAPVSESGGFSGGGGFAGGGGGGGGVGSW